MKHEHRMTIHAGMNRRGIFIGQGPSQIDPAHFTGKTRPDLADGDGHESQSPRYLYAM